MGFIGSARARHLGYPPHFGPLKSGYERYFGPMSGAVDYFSHRDLSGEHDLSEQDERVVRHGYLTDLISEAAVDFVQRHDGRRPFPLSAHYTAPHWPWETRDDEAESCRIGSDLPHLDGGSLAIYRQMIRHMDEGVDRFVAALRDTGQLDDTLIVFTSDNGGERFSDNWPFVGGKIDLLEGGIRVPLLAHWPARIAPARHTTCPSSRWTGPQPCWRPPASIHIRTFRWTD